MLNTTMVMVWYGIPVHNQDVAQLVTLLCDMAVALSYEWLRDARSLRRGLVLLWLTQRAILHVLTFASWEAFYACIAGNWSQTP